MDRRELGQMGEKFALEYLFSKGYQILASNYRVGRLGEIDLVVSQRNCICFIEVKTRTGNKYGTPAEAVSSKKQKTIRQVALCFLKERGVTDRPVQFDVMEVMMAKNGRLLHINHIEAAF